MSSPRLTRLLARWVLACFAFSLGVAVASPLIKTQAMQLVCTGAGNMTLVTPSDDGSVAADRATLDCPLCANLSAPPASFLSPATPVFDLAFALQPLEVARLTSLLRGPWQARAPPAHA